MFKSKIFNSVMRYMLVAMLALLPNAIWGENVFLNDVHKVNINLCDIMWKNNAFAYDYALIYFKDKDGNQVSLDNFALARWGNTSSEYISNVYNSGNGVKKVGNYYMFSQKDYIWGNQEKLYNFTFFNTVLDLSGYQIIFKASNTNDFESDKETSDITITYQLYSQSDIDAVTFTKATDPTLVKSTYALKEGNKCIFRASSIYDEIKTILEVSAKEDIKDFYIRWTIMHTDGTKVDNLAVSSGKIQKRNDFDYIYFNNTGSSIQENDLDVTLELPSGESWDDINLSFVISKKVSELTTHYGIVEKEPTLDALYNVTLATKYSMPFKHYKGYTNADYEVINESNGQLRQKTYTWEYTYPVEVGKPVALTLPMEDFDGVDAHGHDGLEPLGYYRWYNYDTDEASANITADTQDTNYLHEISDEKGNKKGLLAYNLDKKTLWQGNIGVNYTRPDDDNWKGETIACDVSRYIDGMDATGSYLEHESTLSIRYIFHLIPAKQMADMEKDYLTNSENDLTYEDNKNVTVGFANTTSAMTLRLNLKPTMYYFYPMTNPEHHVYFPADQKTERDIVDADFGKELKKATKVIWRIYNGDKDRYFERESNVSGFPRFFDVSQDVLNSTSNTWKDLDGNSVTGNITFNYGDHFSVVAYAVADDNSSCPIANFNCRFFGFHPMMDSEMGNVDVQRKISYLEENYNRVAMISFDNDSPEQTLSYPTNDMDNQSEHPSDWSKRSYGFVYKNLLSKSVGYTGSPNWYDPLHSPLHGEYGIYKTANVKGVSGSDKYMWYDNSVLYDRTYEMTGESQTGSFLYVDASDESRTIASAEFTANLCTGQQMAFSAYVADMTEGNKTQPQLMFKLFGLVGNQKVLLHNFSSGDFESNRDTQNKGEWYQVFGKITIQQEAHAELYDNFRIEIDNYSKGTQGADYAVDDIRIYLKPAKVEVFQDRPACGETGTGSIKLKIRAIHETLNAILNHKNTKIHYRLVNEDGTPVTGEGLYNYWLKGPDDATAKEIKTDKSYASVDVFDSEETCAKYEIDGVNMIEKDADGETYIILANHQFALTKGKKYYVSICADSDPDASDANWGKPSDVCSIYSAIFEMIGQTPMITDTDGKVITEYRVNCTNHDPMVKLTGSLTTIDPVTGEKITLTGVPFLWYIDDNSDPVEATASNTIEIPVSKIGYGAHKIYMKPETDKTNAAGDMVFTVGSVEYLMCTEKIPVPLRIAKDGPQLNFGFYDVDYPFNDNSYEASLRIGLPQLKKLKEKSGYLQIPIHDVSYLSGVTDKTLTFIDDSKTEADKSSADVFVATTNDPLWNAEGATLLSIPVATLSSSTLAEFISGKQFTLDLKFSDDVLKNFHEGYYYELRFVFEQQSSVSAGTTNCPGESYLKVKIVPEFITWTPTADGGMNANWNNDDNWHRSSSTELHDDEYHDYQAYGSASGITPKVNIPTLNSYVPMKFTKVTIDNLKGLPFPDLGNIVYRSTNQIATKLTNGKGNEATKYIQYDIMAYWNEADANKGFEADGNLKCEKFYGNTCHQIYFKPQGELRDQCYLIYDKAWVEKELVPNKWYTMASPLQYIYAGDMYVPASNGRQETKAFTGIKYNDKVADPSTSDDAYSRSKYPVYQRAWMKSDVMEITSDGEHDAWHKPSAEASKVDVNLGYWSHVYNKVDECYTGGSFGGFAIKAGNALLPKDQTENALLRLPKEDTSYQYFDYDGTAPSGGKESDVNKPEVSAIVSSEKNSTGHGKLLVPFNNDEKHLAEMTQSLGADNNSGFYLVANPYTCSISLKKFFEVNTGLQKAVWVVDGDEVSNVSATDLTDKDFFVQPTQSFFVKKDGTASVDAVKFTSAMYVDRLLSTGVIIAPGYLTNVNVSAQNAKGQTSKARIAVREEGSDDYDEQEDVDLLCDQNLSGIPQVYTVAGSQAVAVNATPKIEWMPMGVIMENGEKNEMVSLDFKGVAKLDAPLYLYDAANGQYTELQDGNEVSIQANEHGRYFLTQTRGTTGILQIEVEAESNQLKVYSPAAGMIVVSALNGEKLGRVEVFTLDGKRVHSYQLPDKQRMILRVPSGVYIVKASTQSCAQAKGLKVAVR